MKRERNNDVIWWDFGILTSFKSTKNAFIIINDKGQECKISKKFFAEWKQAQEAFPLLKGKRLDVMTRCSTTNGQKVWGKDWFTAMRERPEHKPMTLDELRPKNNI